MNNSQLTKLLGTLLLVIISWTIMGTRQVGALTLNPNPGPTEILEDARIELTGCDDLNKNPTRRTPAFSPWLSKAGYPTTTIINVNSSDTEVDLEYHFAGAVCFNTGRSNPLKVTESGQNTYAKDTYNVVTDASVTVGSGRIDGAIGDRGDLRGFDSNIGTYRERTIGFKLLPSGGNFQDTTYRVRLFIKSVNAFNDGNYTCVGVGAGTEFDAKTASGGWSFDKCIARDIYVDIIVQVNKKSIQGRVFVVDGSGVFQRGVSGINMDSCNGAGGITDGSGNFTFNVPDAASFCVQTGGGGDAPSSAEAYGPFIRPWEVGYPGQANPCPGFSGGPDVYAGSCSQTSYGSSTRVDQVAGRDNSGSDRSIDYGYDFVYVLRPAISDEPLSCSGPTSVVQSYDEVHLPQTFTATGGNGIQYSWFVSSPNFGTAEPNSQTDVTKTFSTEFQSYVDFEIIVASGPQIAYCHVKAGGPPPPPPIIYTRPFFQVNRGDVSAGGGFNSATGCGGANPNAGILAFNTGSGSYFGAGTSLAAFAWDKIYGFTSAAGRSSPSTPAPPKGLSFSNTAGDPTFGGSFGYAPCATDYGNLPIVGYSVTNSPIITGLSPAIGSRQVIRVNGDIIISGDIIYDRAGSWASIADIPSLYVIAVGGNIYINHTVSQLDGVYVAQPNPAGLGGTIYTCSDGIIPYVDSNLYAACTSSLTVNGSFIAKTIKLLRTKGDYKDSASPPAEIFNYTPELFLVPSPFTKLAPYQSITNLPPVL